MKLIYDSEREKERKEREAQRKKMAVGENKVILQAYHLTHMYFVYEACYTIVSLHFL